MSPLTSTRVSSKRTRFVLSQTSLTDDDVDREEPTVKLLRRESDCSGFTKLPVTGKFLSISEGLKALTESFVHKHIPPGLKNNVYFVVNNQKNIEKRKFSLRSDYADDCGEWLSAKGSTVNTVYFDASGTPRTVYLMNGVYCTENNKVKKSLWIPVKPQPDSVIELHRYYAVLKDNPQYKKRVTCVAGGDFDDLAVVEYCGVHSSVQSAYEPLDEQPISDQQQTSDHSAKDFNSYTSFDETQDVEGDATSETTLSLTHPRFNTMEKVSYRMIPNGSKRGVDLLVDNMGNSYNPNYKKRSTGTIVWTCSIRRKGSFCPATVSQKGNGFHPNSRQHNHPSRPGKDQALEIIAEMKAQARRNVFVSASKIAKAVVWQKTNESPLQDCFVKTSSLIRQVNRFRQRSLLKKSKDPSLDKNVNDSETKSNPNAAKSRTEKCLFENFKEKPSRYNQRFRCVKCTNMTIYPSVSPLINHLQDNHKININVYEIVLRSFDVFDAWKRKQEELSHSCFVQASEAICLDHEIIHYYFCKWFQTLDGSSTLQNFKIENNTNYCSAHIKASISKSKGKVAVEYCLDHTHPVGPAGQPSSDSPRNSETELSDNSTSLSDCLSDSEGPEAEVIIAKKKVELLRTISDIIQHANTAKSLGVLDEILGRMKNAKTFLELHNLPSRESGLVNVVEEFVKEEHEFT